MKDAEINRCEKVAKEGFDRLENIFGARDFGLTECITRSTNIGGNDGAMHGVITFRTKGEPFDDLDRDIAVSNLISIGGFDDVEVTFDRDNTEMSIFSFVGGKTAPKRSSYDHCEISIADLVKFIKDHKRIFPNGMKTKISLGDYEGNEYHSCVSLGADNDRLFISYEMNENEED